MSGRCLRRFPLVLRSSVEEQGLLLGRPLCCRGHRLAGTGAVGFRYALVADGSRTALALDVVLDLAALPILDGALETARRGILSSLQPANAEAASAVRADGQAGHARWPLLFDPQTAGGLLAAVPAACATACAGELRNLGYGRAAVIGAVLPRSNHPEPITLAG